MVGTIEEAIETMATLKRKLIYEDKTYSSLLYLLKDIGLESKYKQ